MAKVAVTIAERPQGSGNWDVICQPSNDVLAQRNLLDDLVNKYGVGNDRVLVLTQYGVNKRKKINLPVAENAPVEKSSRKGGK